MNLGLKEILWSRGRFVLMGSVIALMSALLVLLTGLTKGLGEQSISAIRELDADKVIFATPDQEEPSFTGQLISREQLERFQESLGKAVTPMGVSQARAEGETGAAVNVAVFGGGVPPVDQQVSDGTVVLDEQTARDLGMDLEKNHNALSINGKSFEVIGYTEPRWYSHQPVVWLSLADWHSLSGAPQDKVGTVLLVGHESGQNATNIDVGLLGDTSTTAMNPRDAVTAVASYSSENGSLTLMQAFLYGISGLVVAAFVAVWTVQRTRDIAVLRALGASAWYVLRDSLLQALAVTLGGALIGGLLGFGASLAVAPVVPFYLSTATVVVPVLGVLILGMAAAWLAAQRVSKIDPLVALGGN